MIVCRNEIFKGIHVLSTTSLDFVEQTTEKTSSCEQMQMVRLADGWLILAVALGL
jgi:hypothetical protein